MLLKLSRAVPIAAALLIRCHSLIPINQLCEKHRNYSNVKTKVTKLFVEFLRQLKLWVLFRVILHLQLECLKTCTIGEYCSQSLKTMGDILRLAQIKAVLFDACFGR